MAIVTSADPTPQELRAALSDPDALYEILDGQIIEVPAMSAYGSLIAHRIFIAISGVAHTSGLGFASFESLFILDEARNLRRRPDVAFVSSERWPLDREVPIEGDFGVVPNLVVEVIGPNDTIGSVVEKRRDYLSHGVRQVWLVQPETRDVTVHHATRKPDFYEEGDTLEGGEVLPGFRLPVSALFRRTIA